MAFLRLKIILHIPYYAETNSDLFHAIPMSYGTLGFLTSITIKLIPYKPYLRITYRPTYSLDSCVKVRECMYSTGVILSLRGTWQNVTQQIGFIH